jgi:hypothetical protein
VVRFNPDALESNSTPETATNLGTLAACPSYTRRDNLNLHSGATPQSTSDLDHFRFSLPDHASLEIHLRFVPGLGNIDLMLISESGGARPSRGGEHPAQGRAGAAPYRRSGLPRAPTGSW